MSKYTKEEILELVPVSVLKKNKVFPFEYAENNMNVLRVAMVDPMDMYAQDDIAIITNCMIEPYVTTNRDIMMALDKYYGQSEVTSALEAKYGTPSASRLDWKPTVKVDINDVDSARKFLEFVDALEDDEDVQHVYHNAEIAEDVMAQLAGEE